MQRKKLLVACLSVLLVGLVLPNISLPKAHAFETSITVTLSGLGVRSFIDPQTGTTVDAVAAGSTITVNVAILASEFLPSYQRNVTVGFQGDWMTNYQNASNASPASTLALQSGQEATVSISVAIPSTAGLTPHTWNVAVWDGLLNSQVANNFPCPFGGNGEQNKSCVLISYNSFEARYNPLAFYTSDQLGAAQAQLQASIAVNSAAGAIDLVSTGSGPKPPGTAAAAGQIANAGTEMSLGSQSWKNGDYAGAKTHYQNALNDANAATGDLTGQGGGVDTASLVNLLLGGAGVAMIGIGGLLAGIGAFSYLRKKPKA
jgi:hypothetical protein